MARDHFNGGRRCLRFNSYIFIMAFLPAFLVLYFALGRLKGNITRVLIIFGGLVFYLYAGLKSFSVLMISLFVNYLLSRAIAGSRHKKALLMLTIGFNLALLICFKYLQFSLDAFCHLFGAEMPSWNLFLPLGISFFTIQQIMYVSAVMKEEIRVCLVDYLSYILFFPKLTMGPLIQPSDFIQQLHDPDRKKCNWINLAGGMKLFSFGLFKKMVLADTFARAVDWGFVYGLPTSAGEPVATSYDLLLVILCYTFQIYFDFSGYSDMATGVAQMINIDLPVNFDSPYKAVSIREFWKRWHVSLTNFLTRYVYIPLGGSRKGEVRTWVNIMTVFLISGIWHGANWTFIMWGGLYGLLMILERINKKELQKIPKLIRWGGTFLCVNVLWLLFRAESIGDWWNMLLRAFSLRSRIISGGLLQCFELPETALLLDLFHLHRLHANVRGFSMLLFLLSAMLICLIPQNNYRNRKKLHFFNMLFAAALFIWGFLCLSSESVFVYFNF